jgi:guanosine-3',5'-bis(diphosphate) 3'-pyrophosphohydrolase
MIESPDSDAISFIDDVKGYFFLDEISVFTPQGELRTLPANSSVLDFAYAIHSELGNTCIGAKVDKKLAPLNHVLKNGQQVEIITSRKQSPKEEWINYVVTTRAKASIKMAVREEKKHYFKQGKEKLEKWFLQSGIEFTHQNIKKFLVANNFHSLIDLYYSVALDRLGIKDVKIFASSNSRKGWMSHISKSLGVNKKKDTLVSGNGQKEKQHHGTENIVVGAVGPLAYEVASCCNPIPGDEVIGLVASDRLPMQIHRTKCPKALELITMFGNRLVKINWTNNESISFLTGIRITGVDRRGLINEISRIISNEMKLNIQSFNIEALDGLTEGEINLYVQDTSVLNHVVTELNSVDGITKVTRLD